MPTDQIAIPKPGSAPPPSPSPGTVLAGRFEVIRAHAGGALLGRDTGTLANVLITATDAGLVTPAAAALVNRHVTELAGLPGLVAPVYAGRDGDWFLLVAPLVHGVPLAERLARGGLRPPAALQVARDLLLALEAAHRRDLLHLAISPATVMVNPDGPVRRACLVGFGAAALHDCRAGEPDPAGVRYAAPERAGVLDGPVDRRADLYSVGLVLHECLTGRPAYAATSDGELLRRRLTDPPPALRADHPEVPPALEAEILGLLAVDPADRPPDAGAVLRGLAPIAALPPPARPAHPPVSPRLLARDAELAALAAHLPAARAGRGAVVLLEGPAGIGKTRLLDELCRQAEGQGAIVLRGRAAEVPRSPAGALDGVVCGLLDAAAPDGLVRGPLDAAAPDGLVRGPGDAAAPDGVVRGLRDPAAPEGRRPEAERICALLPGLRPLLGAAPPPGRPAGREPVRWTGAPALADLLAAAGSAAAPALIVLDDCQWADAAVLDLVAAWGAPVAADQPRHAALVVAFRAGGLPAEHPLRQLAAVERIALGPLDDADLAEIARTAGLPSDPAAEAFVRAAAAGNPARAELAAAGLLDAGGVPAEVPESLPGWRIALLTADARKLLGAAAVLGREFSLDLAAAMLGRGDTWAELARAEADRRLLLVPSEHGPSFRHDQVRQALLDALPAAERRRLHARAADLLAADRDAPFDAAHHALATGDPVRAVPRAQTAARAAIAREAPDIAEYYLRAARRHAGELAPETALEIVEDLAAVHLAQGRTDLAEEQLAAAARIAREPTQVAAISASLARLGVSRGDHGAATTAAEAAVRSRRGRVPRSAPVLVLLLVVELLRRLPRGRTRRAAASAAGRAAAPGAGRAAAPAAGRAVAPGAGGAAAEYALLARCYTAGHRRAAAAWATLRALRLAEAAPPGPLLLDTEGALARLWSDAGLRRPARALARRTVATAVAVGDDELTGRALVVAAQIHYAAGALEDAADAFARAAPLLSGAGEVDAALLGRAFCDYRRGDLLPAGDAAQAVHKRALIAPAPELAATALGLARKAGGRAGPTPLPDTTAHPSTALLEASGLELLAAGELQAAAAALDRAASAQGDGWAEREAAASARAWRATALRLAAEAATGPPDAELIRLAGAAARAAVRAARGCASNRPHALREQGRVDALAGRPRRARLSLRQSLRVAERQSAGHEVAETRGAICQLEHRAARPGTPAPLPPPPPPPPAPDAPAASLDERLAALLVGGRRISCARSPEAIFQAVRDAALPLLRAERAVIVHITRAGGAPLVSGCSPPCAEALARVCRALGDRAVACGQTVALSPELGIDPATLARSGVHAALCAPISVGGTVTSCVYVDRSQRAEPFLADDLRLAEFMAAMAAAALENATGNASVEILRRSLEDRVEERTAQLADSNRQLDLSLQRLTEAFERERSSAAELKHQAFHDPLTDLANRTLFVDRVEHALDVARRTGHHLAVLFVDLDDFKTVNDSLGHPAGDELLVAVAARLGEVLRRADTAARLGGDEFGILLEATDRDGAIRTAERILAALDVPFKLAAKEVFVHASIGIAVRDGEEITVESLLRNADVAMYMAKTRGKRSFEVFEQRMHDDIVRRLELKDDLHRGIELRQFAVHYQPIVDIATGRIHGLEALIRWHHPVHGLISPLDFVPLAEETGMIRAIGDWVLRTACEATREWQAQAGHAGERLTIGVNLSARELHEPGLVDCVAAALHGSGLAPEDLTLEITESVLMTETDAAIARLRDLKVLGVQLAIDDFGTGYSSLSYLKDLPVDIVKIAKPFVDDIADGPQEAALAGAIVALSNTLHLKTVAEGIEHPDQLGALRRLGCDFGQGYLFARPAPAAQTAELLAGDRRFPVAGEPSLRLLRAV